MLRRLSQNPVRRYWFHRSKGISFTQLKKRGDHTIQQDAPVIFPINASKFDSIQNMEKNRKRTHTHMYLSTMFFALISRCVYPIVFPRCGSRVVVPPRQDLGPPLCCPIVLFPPSRLCFANREPTPYRTQTLL